MATILIVEDEYLIADEIHRALVRLGHSPLTPVDNSEDALEVLAQQPVELVLMDINIAGDCDGIAAAILVRRQFAVPVVFLTARADSPTLKRANVAQPYAYINKPFTDATLQVQLELALLKAYDSPPPRPARRDPDADLPQPPGPTDSPATSLFLRKGTGSKWVRVLFADVLYFESEDRYVFLHTATEKVLFAQNLRTLESTLPANFVRTHKTYIVNTDYVEAFDDAYVEVGKNLTAIPVGRAFKPELMKRLRTTL
jgi:DNA-binding LytR/AlgR family response regulator